MAKFVCEFQEYCNDYKIMSGHSVFENRKFLWLVLERDTDKFVGIFDTLDEARDYICGYSIVDANGTECKIPIL